jgi:hypothetical protein
MDIHSSPGFLFSLLIRTKDPSDILRGLREISFGSPAQASCFETLYAIKHSMHITRLELIIELDNIVSYVRDYITISPTLRSLTLDVGDDVLLGGINDVPPKCPHLEELKVVANSYIFKDILRVLPICTGLQTLHCCAKHPNTTYHT